MKMIVENISFYVMLCSILFINHYYTTEAMSLRKNIEIEDAKSVISKQDLYPIDYLDKPVYEPEYFYDEPCGDDCGYPEKRSNKRQTLQKGKSKDFSRNLPADFYKYQSFLQNLEKNKKSENFISRSWSAGGMPFNVLYTPNIHQQKILRSVPEKVVITPMNIFPPVGEPMALSAPPPPPPPPSYDLVQEEVIKKPIQKQWPKPLQRQSYRRRYSMIPQLFVSYGWGPTGK